MPIIDKFKEMGTLVMGKVESGSIHEGSFEDAIIALRAYVRVLAVHRDDDKVRRAGPGENVRVTLNGIEEKDILSGFVLSSPGMCFSPSLCLYIFQRRIYTVVCPFSACSSSKIRCSIGVVFMIWYLQ